MDRDYELHLEAGLVDAETFNEDGEREWIGTHKNWDRYEELKNSGIDTKEFFEKEVEVLKDDMFKAEQENNER